jgi:hypothetical protein
MGLGSLILAIFSFLLMIAGVFFVWVPFLGTMLSFLSPVLAITGVVLGGVAMSRAKQGMGESEGLATAGLVLNIVAFVPAMLVALTCGLCNTLCTGAYLQPTDPNARVPWDRDAGGASNPIEDLFDEEPDAGAPEPAVTPPPTSEPVPMQREGDQTPLPPPPLPPGPAGTAGSRPASDPAVTPTPATPAAGTAPAPTATPDPPAEPAADPAPGARGGGATSRRRR